MKDSSKTKNQLIEELKELRGKLFELERSEMKHSDEALREAEEKFRTIFESSNDAITIIGESGVIDFNDAALRMMGYSNREGLVGTNPGDWSPPAQPDGDPEDWRDGHVDARLARGPLGRVRELAEGEYVSATSPPPRRRPSGSPS